VTPSIDAELAAVVTLLAFAALSFVDGVVIHLWRERLHLRPESRFEHALHTARAVLFPLILTTIFAGRACVVGFALLALDQAVEIWDMAIERRSRAYSGGLRSGEYVIHGALIALRSAAIAFALVAPAAGASGGSWLTLSNVTAVLIPLSALTALQHVALLVAPSGLRRRRAAALG